MTQTAKTLWRIIENYPDYVSADYATESEEELAQTVLMMMDRFKEDTTAEIERLEYELQEARDNADDWYEKFESQRDPMYYMRQ